MNAEKFLEAARAKKWKIIRNRKKSMVVSENKQEYVYSHSDKIIHHCTEYPYYPKSKAVKQGSTLVFVCLF